MKCHPVKHTFALATVIRTYTVRTVIALYGSPIKLSNAHKLVTGPKQPAYFVRADVMKQPNSIEALNHAKPMPGETVLNTIEIP